MLPDRVSNPGPMTYESGALPIAQHGPALCIGTWLHIHVFFFFIPDPSYVSGVVLFFYWQFVCLSSQSYSVVLGCWVQLGMSLDK